ncbi:MAG: GTP cyclohydrolase I FolE [Flavobacteriales bacterium]|nr:GTP cyclohydrolase I FolE [Bacteroidota bacterium]MCB9239799.1 GTP cyclohydrolase I FolE [Flavobacteriales bacterium]
MTRSDDINTPIRPDAFELSDQEKIEKIETHVRSILDILGMDLKDDSLARTPHRVAKMYVQELFSGLNPDNKPRVTLFENKYQYSQMLVEKEIAVFSTCEHHLVPIYGKAHVAYISNGEVIGLSKINRIVRYFCRRPQVQERLTRQIAAELRKTLKTEDVAVVIDAAHMCVAARGVEDVNSSTVTADLGGQFQNEATRLEFLRYIGY